MVRGLNAVLGDRSPARLLREGNLDEVGPEVIGAERAFRRLSISLAAVEPDKLLYRLGSR